MSKSPVLLVITILLLLGGVTAASAGSQLPQERVLVLRLTVTAGDPDCGVDCCKLKAAIWILGQKSIRAGADEGERRTERAACVENGRLVPRLKRIALAYGRLLIDLLS